MKQLDDMAQRLTDASAELDDLGMLTAERCQLIAAELGRVSTTLASLVPFVQTLAQLVGE